MPKAQSTQRLARTLSAALLVAGAAALSGCSSATLVDHIPTAVGGLPDSAPERPAVQPAYPAVHDMPPTRKEAVLTEAEKKRIREELNATRDRISAEAAANQAEDVTATTGSTGPARKP